jgi:hypothetical protein
MDHQQNACSQKSFINHHTQVVQKATFASFQLKYTDNWRELTKLTKIVDDSCSILHCTPDISNLSETHEFLLAKKEFDAAIKLKSESAYSVLRSRIEKQELSKIENIAFQSAFAANYIAEITQDPNAQKMLLKQAWNSLGLYSDTLNAKPFHSLDAKTTHDYYLLSHITETLIKTNFEGDKFDWTQQHMFENAKLKITHYSPASATAKDQNDSNSKNPFKILARKLTKSKIETPKAKKENTNTKLVKSLSMDELKKHKD